MTALWWAVGVYLAVGLVVGVPTAFLHVRENFRRIPTFGERELYLSGCVIVASIAAVMWPYLIVMTVRRVRRDTHQPQETT